MKTSFDLIWVLLFYTTFIQQPSSCTCVMASFYRFIKQSWFNSVCDILPPACMMVSLHVIPPQGIFSISNFLSFLLQVKM